MSNPIHSTSAKSVLPMLAMRGLATGLCAGCVVGLLRLSHDRAAARVALWLEEWREVWWTVPIWFGVLVALAVIVIIVGLGGDASFGQNLIDTWNNFALSVQGWFK